MPTINPQIPLEARQTVLDQVVAGASFTAYEITLEVRRRLGPTVEVPHSIVNPIVQVMFANGEMAGYDRAPDTTVKAATPPFRYAPKGARGATGTAPAAIAVNRAQLPVNLRYSNPIASLIRAYSVEARAYHDAAGKGQIPFLIWLPTAQSPVLRIRSVGAVPSEAEVQTRYSLPTGAQTDLSAKAAFAYTNEFRVTTFSGGTAKTFKASLDLNMVGTVTKDGEVPTKGADGVEIEIAVKPSDVQRFCDEAAHVFAYFRVPPHVQSGALGNFSRPQPILSGTGWRLTRDGGAFAIVGDSAFSINVFSFLPHNSPTNIELDFAPGELDMTESGEALDYTAKTRLAIINAFKRVENESVALSEERIAQEPNIWSAKLRFAQLSNVVGNYLRSLQKKFVWQGVSIENERFAELNPNEVTILLTWRSSDGNRLYSHKTSYVEAQPHTVIFLNDVGTRTGSPSRLRAYFATHTNVERTYTLTFISEAARDRFVVANNFQSVPLSLLSSLPKSTASGVHGVRTTNRVPFDPSKHGVLAPQNALAAKFPALSDAEFSSLEDWARNAVFNGKQWPDFKRLYKQIEASVWPLQNRTRWEKNEADLPTDAPLATQREALLLGILIGRLDSEDARRSDLGCYPNGGPNVKTVAYMMRRAERLLRFLRDHSDLSEERRALLAPLVTGSLLHEQCDRVETTLAARLDLLGDTPLSTHPDLVARVWSDAHLPLSVLRWAYNWLTAHGQQVTGTLAHVRRFAAEAEADIVLAILPALLESSVAWLPNYGVAELSRDLQADNGLQTRRGEVLRLFALFPVLKANDEWVLASLDTPEANELEVVEFARALVEARAKSGQLEVARQLSPALQSVFCDALVAAHPNGLSVAQWEHIGQLELVEPLAPALRRMPLSDDVTEYLWAHSDLLDDFCKFGGEETFVNAFAPTIESHAQEEDFDFARYLPLQGQTLFFENLRSTMSVLAWQKLDAFANFPFDASMRQTPLSEAFWNFLQSLEGDRRQEWLRRVGEERAAREFNQQSAYLVQHLMEGDTQGLESLIELWLRANLPNLESDTPVVLQAASSTNTTWSSLALDFIRTHPLNLRVALRLMESGLPEAQTLANPYFEDASDEWAMRALALADSPIAATRVYAFELLARHPSRWTPSLLESLAQHDDRRVQAFVARQLEKTASAPQNEAVKVFDEAIVNARGRSRSAKIGVQRRLNTPSTTQAVDLETLLDAARNGAPRDRAWALQQLVQLQLHGVEVPDLTLSGAVAQSHKN